MTKIKYIQLLLLFITFLSFKQQSNAQVFPAEALFTLTPPFPVYLSDYAKPSGNNISVRLLFRDFNLGTRNIRLRFSISGQNFVVSNLPNNINLPQFSLTAGVPLNLSQADIYAYFLAENLDISPNQYGQALPEGVYKFGVEIIDALTNRPLSGVLASQPFWFVVNEPPFLNLPLNNAKIIASNPQNVIFQWTPRTKQAASIEYEFSLTELLVPFGFEGNLQNIFLSQPAYYQTTTTNTTLLYGAVNPPLIENRYYGFRVQAKAKKGLETVGIFRNEGYSEIYVFRYGTEATFLEGGSETYIIVSSLSKDKGEYLGELAGKSNKKNANSVMPTCTQPTISITDNTENPIALGDKLTIAGTEVEVISDEYVKTNLKLPNAASVSVKLYFSENFKINQYNEVITGSLSATPTNQKINLLGTITENTNTESGINIANQLLKNQLLKLENAKINTNKFYDEMPALALRNPTDISLIKSLLGDFLTLLNNKLTLQNSSIADIETAKNNETNAYNKKAYDEVINTLKKYKQENNSNIALLSGFIKDYQLYTKSDYYRLVRQLFGFSYNTEEELTNKAAAKQKVLEELALKKESEKKTTTANIEQQRIEELGKYGLFPITLNPSQTKTINDKYSQILEGAMMKLEEKYKKIETEILK